MFKFLINAQLVVVAGAFIGIVVVLSLMAWSWRGDDGADEVVDCQREEGLPGAAWGKLYFRDFETREWEFVGYCGRDGKLLH